MTTLEEAFWELHRGLPRQAPGSDATTARLLRIASAGRTPATAVDLGCGPGRSALVLAGDGIDVTAVDLAPRMLDEVAAAAEASGLDGHVTPCRASMDDLPFPDGSFDLVWAEGSAYVMGWEAALRGWKRLLTPAGTLVATECCWLTDRPSDGAAAFWREGYPTMLTVPEARAVATAAGYDVVHDEVLPEADWWDEYYRPLELRLDGLGAGASAGGALAEAASLTRAELAMRRDHGAEYGYVAFVCRPRAAASDAASDPGDR